MSRAAKHMTTPKINTPEISKSGEGFVDSTRAFVCLTRVICTSWASFTRSMLKSPGSNSINEQSSLSTIAQSAKASMSGRLRKLATAWLNSMGVRFRVLIHEMRPLLSSFTQLSNT